MDTSAINIDTEEEALMTPEDAGLIGAVVVGRAFESHVDESSTEATIMGSSGEWKSPWELGRCSKAWRISFSRDIYL